MSAPNLVSKSYYAVDPVKDYCNQHSTPLHPVQKKLFDETLKDKAVGLFYKSLDLKITSCK